MASEAEAKARLRTEMRARRARLDAAELAQAGAAVCELLASLQVMETAQRVAAYRAVRGEVPLDALLSDENARRLTVPRMVGDTLEFVMLQAELQWRQGSFGIPEPSRGEVVLLGDHDVVLAPLVAFDRGCHRLGQGKGFYDRALGEFDTESGRPRPVIIGIAHWFQQVTSVPQEPTDVALDAVVTDRAVFRAPDGLPVDAAAPMPRGGGATS